MNFKIPLFPAFVCGRLASLRRKNKRQTKNIMCIQKSFCLTFIIKTSLNKGLHENDDVFVFSKIMWGTFSLQQFWNYDLHLKQIRQFIIFILHYERIFSSSYHELLEGFKHRQLPLRGGPPPVKIFWFI